MTSVDDKKRKEPPGPFFDAGVGEAGKPAPKKTRYATWPWNPKDRPRYDFIVVTFGDDRQSIEVADARRATELLPFIEFRLREKDWGANFPAGVATVSIPVSYMLEYLNEKGWDQCNITTPTGGVAFRRMHPVQGAEDEIKDD